MFDKSLLQDKFHKFDPLGIGEWAPMSEYDSIIDEIIQVPLTSEREFLVKTTSVIHELFNPEELEKTPEEIKSFIQDQIGRAHV